MVTILEYDQGFASFVHFVDEAIFLIDTARPASGKIEPKRFRLPHPFKGVSHGITQQFIDSFDRALVRMLTIELILPRLRRPLKQHDHSSSSCGLA